MKGKTDPVRAYALVREIQGRTRLEVSKERGLTALVGRDAEIQRLRQIHQRVQPGATAPSCCSPAIRASASRACSTSSCGGSTGPGPSSWKRRARRMGGPMAYRPIVEAAPALPRPPRWREPAKRSGAGSAEQLRFLGFEGDEPAILLAHFLGVSAPPEFLSRLSGPQLKERTLRRHS